MSKDKKFPNARKFEAQLEADRANAELDSATAAAVELDAQFEADVAAFLVTEEVAAPPPAVEAAPPAAAAPAPKAKRTMRFGRVRYAD